MGRRLAEALTNRALNSEDKKATSNTVTERKLAPTLRYEGLLLAETAGTIETFAEVAAEVLLLGGDMKRPAFIKPTFDAFAQTLPHNRRVRFPGLDHGGSTDVGPTNRRGKPEIVAQQSGPSSPNHDPQSPAGSSGYGGRGCSGAATTRADRQLGTPDVTGTAADASAGPSGPAAASAVVRRPGLVAMDDHGVEGRHRPQRRCNPPTLRPERRH